MRGCKGLAALLLLIATQLIFASASFAGDQSTQATPIVETYSGGAVSGRSWFVYGGGIGVLTGHLFGPGWRARALIGQGRYAYDNGNSLIFGTVTLAEAMLGYQFVTGPLTLKLFAGPHYEVHVLSQHDPGNVVSGSKTGAKAQLESWLNLGVQTFASADLSLSTVHTSYFTNLRLGYRPFSGGLFHALALGPEAGALGNSEYDQLRAGGFIGTGIGGYRASLSGGWARNFDGNEDIYAAISLTARF